MQFNPVFVQFIEKINFFLIYIKNPCIFVPIKTNNNLNITIMKTIKKFATLELQVKVLIIGGIILTSLFTTMVLINGFKTF